MDQAEFRQFLNDFFDKDELSSLCFSMGIDLDGELAGETKNKKIISLIKLIQNNDLIPQFVKQVIQERPREAIDDFNGIVFEKRSQNFALSNILREKNKENLQLCEYIDFHLDAEELETLCFDLKIDYENLEGANKKTKILNLLNFSNQQQHREIIDYLLAKRPFVLWDKLGEENRIPEFLDIEQLRHFLKERFSKMELKNLTFELGIDFENLAGSTTNTIANSLFGYFNRREMIWLLLAKIREHRPNGLIQINQEQLAILLDQAIRTNATALDLSYTGVTDFPESISQLNNLKIFSLNGNGLKKIPEWLYNFEKIETLNFNANEIEIIPDWLPDLPLKELGLSNNKINAIPLSFKRLDNLKTLKLQNNSFTNIFDGIGKLSSIEYLDISSNKIYELNDEIRQLSQLKTLYLRDNNIDVFPEWIGQLQNLKHLNLSANNIRAVPKELGELINLTYLDLSYNEIQELPDEIGNLVSLSSLDLSNNAIKRIPTSVGSLQHLSKIELKNNPIHQPPPEIISHGISAIKSYLQKIHLTSTSLYETKLILVGQGEVGKTTLAHRLIYGKFKDKIRTKGIEINQWGISHPSTDETIKIKIWDFGGQELYQPTHQFFWTKKSIYLLVWNARKSRNYEQIYRWLYTIDARSGESPIILVMTKADEMDDDLNLRDIKDAFPQVVSLIKVDSKSGRGIERLKLAIQKEVWQLLPELRATWIPSWLEVRKKLENDSRDKISFEEFKVICQTLEGDNQEIDRLDKYLHDLGIILHYRQAKLSLESVVILNPGWATKAVYAVLDAELIKHQNGILYPHNLPALLDQKYYPSIDYQLLLDLMQRYEIAFKLEGQDAYLIPAHLPSNEPEFNWNMDENLIFSYSYDFLPSGIFSRFISSVHHYIIKDKHNQHLAWGDGVIIEWENTLALIRVNRLEKIVNINVVGNSKRELLAIIRSYIDKINDSIDRIRITKQIPCKCSPNCTNKFNYKTVIGYEKDGRIPSLLCDISRKEVPIKALLEGFKVESSKTVSFKDHLGNQLQYVVYGDIVYGDVIEGDKIDIGQIINSQGVSVGSQSQASVYKTST